ncbi:EamA family transporter [Olsenella sp. HMSC062G07]|uniref:EamA family transporter n=1 Tax=Olsenella sp. HMSC062G07 TaxID=1739330 RepID=UPI0008A0F980|nr:EamA family transporter [Olsenella sp. HMSC062G07]OFK22303.1 multidrug DMT transporter permease [Olsenella sp. HMSC062G07]
MWVVAAAGSALFAGITAILAKLGIRKTDSDVATAMRTLVVLAFSWLMALITRQFDSIGAISLRSWVFLTLSGVATGASWMCYFKALSMGDVNKVVPMDKTSSVLTVLLAIVLFGETRLLPLKLACSLGILVGTLLMVKRRPATADRARGSSYLVFAVGSAVCAALTSVLAKVGVAQVPSNLATAIRTCVVLVMAWGIVALRGKLPHARPASLDRGELAFLILSGVSTGASWLCYYLAIQTGPLSVVVPIDKLSIVVSMAFSAIVLKERYSTRSLTGLALIVVSTVVMAVWA